MAEAGGVFGLVVVPVGVKADLPQHRGRHLAIAEHGAFQLPGLHALLHHQAGVVAGRFAQARQQGVAINGLADAHRGAQVGRLNEAGIAELGLQPL